MADIQAEVSSAYSDIVKISSEAFDNLKNAATGGFVDVSPANFSLASLQFDPGAPESIVFKNPIDMATILTNIDSYIAKIASVTAPTFPDTPSIKMTDHEMWSSTLATSMKSNIQSYITSMGIPDVTYQNAIFNEEYNRNLQTLNDMFDLADAKVGARGFSYSNDFGNGLKIDAQQKYQFDKTQVSRSISKTIVEWARQNYQFAIEKGLSYENMQMDFTYKYCTAFVSIYKDLVTSILESYKAQVEVIVAPVDALIKELNAILMYTSDTIEVDRLNTTLKQSRAGIQINEALQKYSHDAALAGSKLGDRLRALETIVSQSAILAQANTSSIIGLQRI